MSKYKIEWEREAKTLARFVHAPVKVHFTSNIVFAAAGRTGNVTAGGDAVVITYGNEQGSVTAGSGSPSGTSF
ncbi:MAG TPA: hypothetical protein VND64_26940, partial [Pirellulales bacterium]|nr:hypothetical protein [Pirellulales bacterium]